MKVQNLDKAKIIISGHQVDLGESFKHYAQSSLQQKSEKYWKNIIKTEVIVSKTSNQYKIEITCNIGRMGQFTSTSQHKDIYTAFNSACAKNTKQLRRMKRKVKDSRN